MPPFRSKAATATRPSADFPADTQAFLNARTRGHFFTLTAYKKRRNGCSYIIHFSIFLLQTGLEPVRYYLPGDFKRLYILIFNTLY